jgi:hypothetical protein
MDECVGFQIGSFPVVSHNHANEGSSPSTRPKSRPSSVVPPCQTFVIGEALRRAILSPETLVMSLPSVPLPDRARPCPRASAASRSRSTSTRLSIYTVSISSASGSSGPPVRSAFEIANVAAPNETIPVRYFSTIPSQSSDTRATGPGISVSC